jgi:Flp pilus assembly protein TadD
MKTNTRNIKRGVAIFVVLLSISFTASCYLKNQSEENADYLMPEQKIIDVTKKDIKDFLSSVKARNGQAESNYKLGLYFQERKRHNLAIEEFEKAVEQQPDMARAYNAMGISNDKLGKPSQALHCFQLAIKLDPQMDSAYNNLGYSYLLEDDLDAAIAAFQKAIALNDQNKRYRNNLGLAYVMKGDYDQAKEQFKMLDNEFGAEQKLATLLYKLGKVKVDQQVAKNINTSKNTVLAENTVGTVKPLVTQKKVEVSQAKTVKKGPAIVRKKIDKAATVTEIYEPDQVRTTVYGANTAGNDKKLPDQPIANSLAEIVLSKNSDHSGEVETNNLPQENPRAADVNFSAGRSESAAPEIAVPVFSTPEPPTAVEPTTQLLDTRTVIAAVPTVSAESNVESMGSTGSSNVAQPFAFSDSVITITAVEPDQVADVKIEVAKPEQLTMSMRGTTKENSRILIAAAHTIQAESTATSAASIGVPQPPVFSGNEQTVTETEAQKLVDVEIEVANGNGENGMARRVGNYLESRGFKVTKISNANSFEHAKTKLIYGNGRIKDVRQLVMVLVLSSDVKQQNLIELKQLGNRIKIIIGKDMAPEGQMTSRKKSTANRS